MLLQAAAILLFIRAETFLQFTVLAILLGMGAAIVYPTFLAAIADYTHPRQRAESIGVFRPWRDLGYAVGALLTGIVADILDIDWAIAVVGLLTFISATIIWVRMESRSAVTTRLKS